MQLSRISGALAAPDDFDAVFPIYESAIPAARWGRPARE